MELDSTDLDILARLENDSSVRRKILAAQSGISEPTLSKKIGTLTAQQVIRKFTIDIDYRKLGFSTRALTLISLAQQSDEALERLTDRLRRMPNAIEVATTLGEWDLAVRWMVTGPDDLAQAVRELLKIAPLKVETLILGEILKDQRGATIKELND